MSIRQGNKIISGGDRLPGWGTPLLSCMWADHKLNSVSWLRADTFSWQSGNIYISAYNHLVEDLYDSGTTIHTEVISGNTITYYLTPDKHRICLGDQAQVVDAIYQATGISWYFILDEDKKRFKLPRTKWGFTGLRNGAGESIEAGLPNITGYTGAPAFSALGGVDGKVFKDNPNVASAIIAVGQWEGHQVLFDASGASSIYGNSNTVQPPATEMYLYFYVGNFDVNKDILDTAKLSELVNEFNITEFEAEVQESKNKAISEISTIYPEVAKYPGMVTNCITEIPQDIKLELNDGVLTLKAGSKSYRCDGTITTASHDIETSITVDGQYFLYMETSTYITRTFVDKTISSATEPTNPTNLSGYFNTTDNKVYKYSGGWGEEPLPFAIVTVTDGAISSIDQVFNGFGYIGSIVFTLPGLKGVYPNGRNEDGTLKNGNINCTSVQVSSNFNDTRNASLMIDNKGQCKWYSTTGWYYDEVNNIMYATHDNAVLHHANLGTFTVLNGTISNFNNDTVFHAVDYNDTDFVAHQAMPSERFTTLSLGASGSTYTAPGDGWFYMSAVTTAVGQFVILEKYNRNAFRVSCFTTNSGYWVSAVLPVSKGEVVAIEYKYGGTLRDFGFRYANGSK